MKIATYDDIFRAYINPTLLALFYTEEENYMDLAYLLANEVQRRVLIYLYHTDTYADDRAAHPINAASIFMNKMSRESNLVSDKISPYNRHQTIWTFIYKDVEEGRLPYNQNVINFLKMKV